MQKWPLEKFGSIVSWCVVRDSGQYAHGVESAQLKTWNQRQIAHSEILWCNNNVHLSKQKLNN